MPIFNSLLQNHRQRLREEKEEQRRREEEDEEYKHRLEQQSERNKRDRTATAFYAGESARRQQYTRPKRAAPITSLQMYMKNSSYKEFVEEYHAEKRAAKENDMLMIEGGQGGGGDTPGSAKRRELKDAIAADAALNSQEASGSEEGSEGGEGSGDED